MGMIITREMDNNARSERIITARRFLPPAWYACETLLIARLNTFGASSEVVPAALSWTTSFRTWFKLPLGSTPCWTSTGWSLFVEVPAVFPDTNDTATIVSYYDQSLIVGDHIFSIESRIDVFFSADTLHGIITSPMLLSDKRNGWRFCRLP